MKIPELKISNTFDLQDRTGGLSSDFAELIQDGIKDFIYEPMTDVTAERIRQYVVDSAMRSGGFGAPCSVSVDFMNDLDGREGDCRECAQAGSYEEYKLKCAALNKPDVAGSENEWRRMSMYQPGQCIVNTTFHVPGQVQIVEYETKFL